MKVLLCDLIAGHEPVVLLFDDPDHTFLKCQLEHGNQIGSNELRRDGSTVKIWELLLTACYILLCLHNGELIRTALRLDWQNILSAPFVDTNVNFVDFNLP